MASGRPRAEEFQEGQRQTTAGDLVGEPIDDPPHFASRGCRPLSPTWGSRLRELEKENHELREQTGRLEAEEALEKDRDLLRTLIDHLPDCIYVKDAQHRFVTANAAVARIMGTVLETLLGKTDDAFYPQPMAAEFRRDEEAGAPPGPTPGRQVEPHFDAGGNPPHPC